MGGLKTFYTLPQNCKTESAKFHEIVTSVCVGGGLKTFLYPPKLLVCVFFEGGLKTETGKFLLHFQNSKSSKRSRSVYGTDIIICPLAMLVPVTEIISEFFLCTSLIPKYVSLKSNIVSFSYS